MAKSRLRERVSERAARSMLDGAACGCTPGARSTAGKIRNGVRARARTTSVDASIKAANLKHLKRIEGQVRGIAAMIEEDRYCADIIQQAAAVQESLRSVAKNLLRNHFTHCSAAAMHEVGARRDHLIEELLELVGRVAR